jgi:hypothetical protein
LKTTDCVDKKDFDDKKKRADCGVAEEHFPCVGVCCEKRGGLPGTPYRKICADCSAFTSLPDGKSLEVATIFECRRFGYGKRARD